MIWCAGNWNAYCEAAPDYQEYRSRLDEVPPDLRQHVIRHCQTVSALAMLAAEKRARRAGRRSLRMP